MDRERAGVLGVTTDDVAKSVVAGTSSSRYTAANYWADPKSGIGYQVQVEIPEQQMNSLEEVKNLPIARRSGQQIDAPQCGQRHRRHGARRIRPLQHAAHADTEREHLRRGSGTCGGPRAAGDQRYGKAARSGERDRARASPADGGDVRRPASGALDGGGCHPSAAGRQFPIVPAFAGGGV